jgi:Flp pilus assembly protein TadG
VNRLWQRWCRARNDDRGFVLVFVAISMTMILLICGFGVDLGAWYREGADLQRAVDAASLAGVTYMPGDPGKAQATVTATLEKNGVVDGVGGMHVDFKPSPVNPHRLEVCVTDDQVETYFTSIINLHPTIKKCGKAEYELPIPMGSPLNEMDAASLGGIDLAIDGYCSASEDGDQINSRYRAMFSIPNRQTGYVGCPPSSPDDALYYDAKGYTYAVAVPAGHSDIDVEVYDGAYETGSAIDGVQAVPSNPQVMNTKFTLTDETAGYDQPFAYGNDTVLALSNDPAFASTWVHLFTIPQSAPPGRYRIHVQNTDASGTPCDQNPVGCSDAHDLNGFDLRAHTAGMPFVGCSTITTAANYDAHCPEVFAENHLGVFAHTSTTHASFYLCSIDPFYAGHTLIIDLFDPGEGGQTIQVQDPGGNMVPFTWDTPDSAKDPLNELPFMGSGGTVTALDVSGIPGALPGRINPGVFNERLVELRIKLPSDFSSYNGNTWWKLVYDYGTNRVGDRTTWGVRVDGDPVRLVDGR